MERKLFFFSFCHGTTGREACSHAHTQKLKMWTSAPRSIMLREHRVFFCRNQTQSTSAGYNYNAEKTKHQYIRLGIHCTVWESLHFNSSSYSTTQSFTIKSQNLWLTCSHCTAWSSRHDLLALAAVCSVLFPKERHQCGLEDVDSVACPFCNEEWRKLTFIAHNWIANVRCSLLCSHY